MANPKNFFYGNVDSCKEKEYEDGIDDLFDANADFSSFIHGVEIALLYIKGFRWFQKAETCRRRC